MSCCRGKIIKSSLPVKTVTDETLGPAKFLSGIKGYSGLKPFRAWVQMVLPEVYTDALSYQELIYRMLHHLNKMIEDLTAMQENVDALVAAYKKLECYLNCYLKNHLSEEIDAALDRMSLDGTLGDVIGSYFMLGSGLQSEDTTVSTTTTETTTEQIENYPECCCECECCEGCPYYQLQDGNSVVSTFTGDGVTVVTTISRSGDEITTTKETTTYVTKRIIYSDVAEGDGIKIDPESSTKNGTQTISALVKSGVGTDVKVGKDNYYQVDALVKSGTGTTVSVDDDNYYKVDLNIDSDGNQGVDVETNGDGSVSFSLNITPGDGVEVVENSDGSDTVQSRLTSAVSTNSSSTALLTSLISSENGSYYGITYYPRGAWDNYYQNYLKDFLTDNIDDYVDLSKAGTNITYTTVINEDGDLTGYLGLYPSSIDGSDGIAGYIYTSGDVEDGFTSDDVLNMFYVSEHGVALRYGWQQDEDDVSSTIANTSWTLVNGRIYGYVRSGDTYYVMAFGASGLMLGIGSLSDMEGELVDIGSSAVPIRTLYYNALDQTSDREKKKDIEYCEGKYHKFIQRLRPVTYRYKKDGDDSPLRTGFIAQDVLEDLEDAGLSANDFAGYGDGDVKTLDYTAFIAPMVSEIQRLNDKCEEQETQIADLTARLEKLEQLMEQ